jgi:hypothetical protein
MVYLDTDDLSQTMTQFWDETAAEYPFIQFGRINYASQSKLISLLPFRVEEIPFVLSYQNGKDSEFLEFDGNRDVGPRKQSLKPELKKFVKESIEKRYEEVTVENVKQLVQAPQTERPVVIQVTRNFTPVSFCYLSYKFADFADFYTTRVGDHRRVYSFMETPYVDYIIKVPQSFGKANENLTFKFGSEAKPPKEIDHLNIFPLVKFLTIPEIKKSNFGEYCLDYSTSEDTES